jgi:hypothetical protein
VAVMVEDVATTKAPGNESPFRVSAAGNDNSGISGTGTDVIALCKSAVASWKDG